MEETISASAEDLSVLRDLDQVSLNGVPCVVALLTFKYHLHWVADFYRFSTEDLVYLLQQIAKEHLLDDIDIDLEALST